MKNVEMLLDVMLNLEVVPNDITFDILLDGHCKYGSSLDFNIFNGEKRLVSDYASYTAFLNKSSKISKDRLLLNYVALTLQIENVYERPTPAQHWPM